MCGAGRPAETVGELAPGERSYERRPAPWDAPICPPPLPSAAVVGSRARPDAAERARPRGCALVQVTGDKRRADAHRFRTAPGFARGHARFGPAL
ncbi:hypothetical protein [Streptomyces sp. NPDC048191]|uniref:hypothetical protein n=1 Tax=Streptomyces sp. NPDC048191 TaxID=3155484 RepID=UPI0033E2B3CD